MEKYLYLTPDEYEAMVCISGRTPVTGFSKMKYLEIGERRKQLLKLFNKGFVVNAGESFVVSSEWKDAFACIHSAKTVLYLTARKSEAPDLLVYVGKNCVLLENISTKAEFIYRISLWEPVNLVEMLTESVLFPRIKMEQDKAEILKRSENSDVPVEGTENIEYSITQYPNGSEEVLFSASFFRLEALWYILNNSVDAKRMEMADSRTVTEILQLLLDVNRHISDM